MYAKVKLRPLAVEHIDGVQLPIFAGSNPAKVTITLPVDRKNNLYRTDIRDELDIPNLKPQVSALYKAV